VAVAAADPDPDHRGETTWVVLAGAPTSEAAIMSEWSPKIDRAWVATVRAATWITVGVSSPAILNMLGSISSRPWEAVKVVASAPLSTAPCSTPAAPASLWSSTTSGTWPHRLGRPAALQVSASSPMGGPA
jgi:hypothetical protein